MRSRRVLTLELAPVDVTRHVSWRSEGVGARCRDRRTGTLAAITLLSRNPHTASLQWLARRAGDRTGRTSFQSRQVIRLHKETNRAGLPRGPFDEAVALQGLNHIVNRRRGNPEVAL